MIGLFDKIKDHVTPGITISEYCLNTIRLKKLLEQSRRLITLFDDGREKSKGEYVFDFQYVASLSEAIAETLGKIVFNASVIAYSGSEQLYTQYDKHRKMSGKFIQSAKGLINSNRIDGNTPADLLAEPEYGLLKQMVDWFDNPHQNNLPSLKSFMADVFCHVFNAPFDVDRQGAKASISYISYHGIINEISATGLYGGIDSEQGIEACRPFVLLKMPLARNQSAPAPEGETVTRKWTAVYSTEYISLSYCEGKRLILNLICLYSGYTDSDFIFVYSTPGINLSAIVPENMNVALNKTGHYAWCYNRSISEIEATIVTIAQTVFGSEKNVFSER